MAPRETTLLAFIRRHLPHVASGMRGLVFAALALTGIVSAPPLAAQAHLPNLVRLRGRVIREDPMSGEWPAQLTLRVVSGSAQLDYMNEIGAGSAVVVVERDGSFRFENVWPGEYRIEPFPVLQVRVRPLKITVTDRDISGLQMVVSSDQPGSIAELRALLESPDAHDQAWGAWQAARSSRSELIPVIEKMLMADLADRASDNSSAKSDLSDVAVDTGVDALIQLGARPPLDLVQRLYALHPNSALILLSRLGPEADAYLLERLSQLGLSWEVHWLAIANLLLAHGTPGLAAAALRSLTIQAQLVSCPPGRPCSVPERRISVIGDCFLFGSPSDVPPWPIYSLSPVEPSDTSDNPRSNLVSTGLVSIMYTRTVLPAGTGNCRGGEYHGRNPDLIKTEDRLRYIAAAAPSVRGGLAAVEIRKVEWQGAEAFATERARFREDIVARYAAWIRELQSAGAITASEASSLPAPVIGMEFVENGQYRE